MTDEEVAGLPESLREKAVQERSSFSSRLERLQVRASQFGDLWFARNLERVMGLAPAEAVKDTFDWNGKKVNTVKELFVSRKDFQYEGFQRLSLESIPKL